MLGAGELRHALTHLPPTQRWDETTSSVFLPVVSLWPSQQFLHSCFLRESGSSIPGKSGAKYLRESWVPGKWAPGNGNLIG